MGRPWTAFQHWRPWGWPTGDLCSTQTNPRCTQTLQVYSKPGWTVSTVTPPGPAWGSREVVQAKQSPPSGCGGH